MSKKARRIVIIIASILLIAGLVLVLYQPVSVELGKAEAQNIIEEFDKTVERSKKHTKAKTSSAQAQSQGSEMNVDVEALKAACIKYNKSLIDNQGTVNTSDYTKAALRLGDYGVTNNVFGYITAQSIGMKLPIYLGANNSMMSIGAAHMCNTSLPVNMSDTNCSIAGHTGYRGRVFFDNLRQLSIGDEVKIKTYWQTIKYNVIDTKIVTDKQSQDFYIQKGRKLLTLMTCVSNSKGGFDRFLVICEKKN